MSKTKKERNRRIVTVSVGTVDGASMDVSFNVPEDAKREAIAGVLASAFRLSRSYGIDMRAAVRRVYRHIFADELLHGRQRDVAGAGYVCGYVMHECSATSGGPAMKVAGGAA